MAGAKKKIMVCEHCGSKCKGVESCLLCKKLLCRFHRKPQAHGCEAVDWDAMEARRSPGLAGMGLVDLLKAGAILMAAILIGRIVLDTLSGLWNRLSRSWQVVRTEVAVVAAVSLLLSATTVIFPKNAELLDAGVDTLADITGLDRVQVDFQKMADIKPDPLFGLKSCTIAMSYSSTLESIDGSKCRALCEERGYASYGIAHSGNSLDCYCCSG